MEKQRSGFRFLTRPGGISGKTILLAFLLVCRLACADVTNEPSRIRTGEVWSSTTRLERIARDHVAREKIDFKFEQTTRQVLVQRRGTNVGATIWFRPARLGSKELEVEIAPEGKVITNHLRIAICGNVAQGLTAGTNLQATVAAPSVSTNK